MIYSYIDTVLCHSFETTGSSRVAGLGVVRIPSGP